MNAVAPLFLVMQTAAVQSTADTARLSHKDGIRPPIVAAARASRAPRIDGRLDDEAWAAAQPVSTFLQSNPKEGEPGTERTEVRILYDDAAIYIGARMAERDPS